MVVTSATGVHLLEPYLIFGAFHAFLICPSGWGWGVFALLGCCLVRDSWGFVQYAATFVEYVFTFV